MLDVPFQCPPYPFFSGGQLGAVHRETGERLQLTDYISKYERVDAELDALTIQSVEKIRADIIFHRLYRAIVEVVFNEPTSESPPLLNTTVELRALEDLPGFRASEHPADSALAVVVNIAISVGNCLFRKSVSDFDGY